MTLKKFLSLFLALVTVFSIAALPLSAAEQVITETKTIAQTTAYEDLSQATANGSKIEMAIKYPKNPLAGEKDGVFITFVETGYKEHGDAAQMRDYALYCYVYYPRGTYPILNSNQHEITLATSFTRTDMKGDPITAPEDWIRGEMKSFKMTLVNLNKHPETGYGVFPVLKFKIDVSPLDLQNTDENGNRRYDAGEVEIHFEGDSQAKSITAGQSVVCSGYRKGDGRVATKDTYSTSTSNIDVVDIKVKQTHFRYANKADVHEQTQLSSVYFALDREFYERWDEIVNIRAEWFEAHSSPIVVTSDEALYKELMGLPYNNYTPPMDYISRDLTAFDPSVVPERTLATFQEIAASGETYYRYFWQYNSIGRNSQNLAASNAMLTGNCNFLSWFFRYPENAGTKGEEWQQSLVDASVSTKQLQDHLKYILTKRGYLNEDGELNRLLENALKDAGLIETAVDTGRKYGWQVQDLNGTLSIDGYDQGEGIVKWWNQLIYGYRDNAPLEGIQVIEEVDFDDFTNNRLDDEALCNKYYIAKEDVAAFCDYCNKAESKDQVVICLRFAITDYYAAPLQIITDGIYGASAIYEDLAYVAQETMFFNFDILSFTCAKDGVNTIIPVAMESQHITGDINAPPDQKDPAPDVLGNISKGIGDWLEEFKRAMMIFLGIFAGVAVVIVVVMLINPAMDIFGAVGKGVGSVAKGASNTVKKVGRALKPKRKKSGSRKRRK